MSSLTPTATSSDSSAPSSSATDNGNGGGGGGAPPSSTLYLLTFLATLFVLLFVSCAIVLRSFLIRRRYRLHIEQQIAAGILPPDALDPRPKRDFGEKPKLWDVYVDPEDKKGLLEYEGWEDILPMSTQIAHDSASHAGGGKIPSTTSHLEPTHPSPPPSSILYPPRYYNISRLFQQDSRARPPPDTPAIPLANVANPGPPEITQDQDIQIAVMVAMPSESRQHESLPELLIGMSTVPVKGD
ncbi:hypothetical protein BDY19DRAFT_908200 [Irpex rosettiformis]|uniref:Uncharacterized protein n=1 Tax=Irpex rosettiformis TaxID=378272 RepID=A0ACB8TWU7_9APHY|nr:hypothetical protein BDY19DRAFT_908200 [Irpex rosettiformis]